MACLGLLVRFFRYFFRVVLHGQGRYLCQILCRLIKKLDGYKCLIFGFLLILIAAFPVLHATELHDYLVTCITSTFFCFFVCICLRVFLRHYRVMRAAIKKTYPTLSCTMYTLYNRCNIVCLCAQCQILQAVYLLPVHFFLRSSTRFTVAA